jgi:hypothetical protein
MNCPTCGKSNRSIAIFCASCGKTLSASSLNPSSAHAFGWTLAQAAKSKTGIILISGLLGLFILALLLLSSKTPVQPSTPSAQPDAESKAVTPEIEISKLGFASRRQVIKMIGKPEGTAQNGEDQYLWGTLEYKNGRVVALDYHYLQRPTSVDSALAKVGLVKTSEPTRRESSNYQWAAPFAPPLVCCGFRFENVLLSGDFSDITIVFEKRIAR